MKRNEIVDYLNAEIARLTSARDLLTGQDLETPRRPGRPKGSTNKTTSFDPGEFSAHKRRMMTPEGKARIAAAQKQRWAAQKSKSSRRAAPTPSSPARKTAPAKKNVLKAASKAAAKKAAAKKARTPVKAVAPAKATPAAE